MEMCGTSVDFKESARDKDNQRGERKRKFEQGKSDIIVNR